MNFPTKIMGILNVTPDSFSDGGDFLEVEKAVLHAEKMVAQGADIIDIGGESTRPESVRVPWEVELSRIEPVLRELKHLDVQLSVDTMNSKTAIACLDLGVDIINDVSGGIYDPDMYKVIADSEAMYICQHWRVDMDPIQAQQYWRVTHDVMHELYLRIQNMREAGVRDEKVVIDPGLGFYKTHEQSWELLSDIDKLKQMGFPVLIGASRKRMTVLYGRDSVQDRDKVTAKITAFCAEHGAWAVRVHNVALNVQSLKERARQ